MIASDKSAQLNNIRLAAPCNKDWNGMPGDDRIRFCDSCSKSVYNISDMTKKEAEKFLLENGVSKCMRIFRRSDGTIINDNCPVGLRKIRNAYRWVATVVASAVSFCCATTSALAQAVKLEEIPKGASLEFLEPYHPKQALTNGPSGPIVTGSVDFGGFTTGPGIEVEEIKKRSNATRLSKALRKKMLKVKIPKAFSTAVYFQQIRDWTTAIKLYREALIQDSTFDSTYTNLAVCLLERKADGDIEEALEVLSRSENSFTARDDGAVVKSGSNRRFKPNAPLSKQPVKTGTKLLALGLLSEKQGDLKAAEKFYYASLRELPYNLNTIKQLSELHVRQGHNWLAMELLNRSYSMLNWPNDCKLILKTALINLQKLNNVEIEPRLGN